jgi:hypothetical protein
MGNIYLELFIVRDSATICSGRDSKAGEDGKTKTRGGKPSDTHFSEIVGVMLLAVSCQGMRHLCDWFSVFDFLWLSCDRNQPSSNKVAATDLA